MPITLAMLAAALLAFAAPLHADDDEILPPPNDNAAESDAKAGEDGDVNLNRELSPPEDGAAVEIRSYKREDGSTIEEHSVNGRVFMIKVQPEGGLPAYYLYDTNGDGTFDRRLPGGYKRISPPMWVIHRF